MVNNEYTGWHLEKVPDALRGLNGSYLFRLEPFFSINKIKKIKNKVKLKLSILTPFLVENQPEV